MKTINNSKAFLLAAALTAIGAVPALAYEDLHVKHQGDVTYLSGGVGMGERDAMKDMARKYNLHITNADREGLLTADTDIIIRSKNGHEVIKADDTGPLFYAKLPPGTYTLQAENEGRHYRKTFTISGHQHENVSLIWKDHATMSVQR